MSNNPTESADTTITGTGTFTPPQPDCSPECHYEGFEIVHDPNCEEA